MITTIWERRNDGRWEYNHYEEGYDPARTRPTPKHENHVKGWAGGEWRGTKGELVNGVLRSDNVGDRNG